jgi:hypothetical protein
MKDTVVRRRFVRTSAALLVIGSAAISLGMMTHVSNASKTTLPNAAAMPVAGSGVPKSETGAFTDVRAQRFASADTHSAGPDSFTYVVQPQDTIRDLSLSIFGRYDRGLLAEIHKLNPSLKNPNRIEPGQEIRLPLSSQAKKESGAPSHNVPDSDGGKL